MRAILIAAAFALAPVAALPALAQSAPQVSRVAAEQPAGTYKLDKGHASVTWRVMHSGISMYTARFSSFDASLEFDAADVTKSKVSATIDATSVDTGHRDKEGKRSFDEKVAKDALGAEKTPQITFVSTKVEKTGDTTGKVTGDLTLNGVTKPVTMDVSFYGGRFLPFMKAHGLGFSGKTSIKRSEWGVKNWLGAVGDDVEILIEAEFVKAA